MMEDPAVFVCRRCGQCCKESWEIAVDFEKDLLGWIHERRFEILKHVVLNPKFLINPERYGNRPQWMIDGGHVLFGEANQRCPFLIDSTEDCQAGCRIHDVRPQVCRRFPYDETGKVRSDILDVCMASIFYHSRAAEVTGLGIAKYFEELNGNGVVSSPKRSEMEDIAVFFKDKGLKIKFLSEDGLGVAEELVSSNRPELERDITQILFKG